VLAKRTTWPKCKVELNKKTLT